MRHCFEPSIPTTLKRPLHPPIGLEEYAAVPTALAVIDHMHTFEGTPPREWVERLYDVRRYTRMPRGGHFAAAEAPQLVADFLRSFFTELRG